MKTEHIIPHGKQRADFILEDWQAVAIEAEEVCLHQSKSILRMADQYRDKWISVDAGAIPKEIITIGYWQNEEFLQEMIFWDGLNKPWFSHWHKNLSPPTV